LFVTQPLTVSILSERRSFQPYGMAGGEPGQRGLNLLYIREEKNDVESRNSSKRSNSGSGEFRVVSLGGKNTVEVSQGDRLVVVLQWFILSFHVYYLWL
jgi:5-oxoprolinase (ATP-hydrolysing)